MTHIVVRSPKGDQTNESTKENRADDGREDEPRREEPEFVLGKTLAIVRLEPSTTLGRELKCAVADGVDCGDQLRHVGVAWVVVDARTLGGEIRHWHRRRREGP